MTTTGTRGGGIGPTDRGRTGTGTAALVPVPEALIVVVRIETVRIAAVPIAAGRTATVDAVTAPVVTGRSTVGRTATVVAATAPAVSGRTASVRPATVRREASVRAARVAVGAAPSDVGTTRATVRVFRATSDSVAGDTAGTTPGREPGVTIADRTTGAAASGTPGPAAGKTLDATRSGPTPRTRGCGTTVVGTSAAPRTHGTSAVTTMDDRGAALPPLGRTPPRSGLVPWMNEGSRSRGRRSAPSSPSGTTRPAREPGVEVRMGRASRPAICPRESACRR